MKNLKKYFKGFTLVELIIVITILAILATIAFVSFQSYTKDARDANRTATIKNIEKGLELFTIKTGNFPTPDEPTTFTGWLDGKVKISQGIVWDGVATIINMNTTPLDPNDKSKYTYSTFWDDNKYYQVAINAENRETSFIPQTYAFTPKSAIVQWNYRFDPSLPSLIVVPSSVNTASWIFDPKVCFVIDGWQNSLSSSSGSCIEKEEMSLKEFDNSLQWYWSFDETWFTVENHQYWWTNFFKDYSWNWNHAFNSWWYLWTWFVFPTQTGWYVWRWSLYFTSWALYLWWLEKDIFGLPYKNISISMIANLLEYKNPYPYLIYTYHSTWNISCHEYPNCNNQFSNEFLWFQLNSKTNTWVHLWNQRWYIPWQLIITNKPYYYTFVYDWYYLKTYLNWKLYWKIKKDIEISYAVDDLYIQRLDKVLRLGWWGNRMRDFHWIIDDVKIYNRALTDEEIRQQAKIAGF